MIYISNGNNKLGKDIPNISLTPIESCINSSYCFQKKLGIRCYANKFYKMYPNVRKNWSHNYKEAKENQPQFEVDLKNWFDNNKPNYFRIHVGGDFFSESYYKIWERLAKAHNKTKFLAFTKNFSLDLSSKPDNLSIVYSIMPNMKDIPTIGPKAYTGEKEWYGNINPFVCHGSCDGCRYCWEMGQDDSVIFHVH